MTHETIKLSCKYPIGKIKITILYNKITKKLVRSAIKIANLKQDNCSECTKTFLRLFGHRPRFVYGRASSGSLTT